MGGPDGLPSMGSHRVRHDWSDLAAAAGIIKVLYNVDDLRRVLIRLAIIFTFYLYLNKHYF